MCVCIALMSKDLGLALTAAESVSNGKSILPVGSTVAAIYKQITESRLDMGYICMHIFVFIISMYAYLHVCFEYICIARCTSRVV